MSTLIAVHLKDEDSGAEEVIACTKRCYDATCRVCKCVCGGANHGVGRQQAIDQTRDSQDAWVEQITQARGPKVTVTRVRRAPEVIQAGSLFSHTDILTAGPAGQPCSCPNLAGDCDGDHQAQAGAA
jgi:hypothetical protein